MPHAVDENPRRRPVTRSSSQDAQGLLLAPADPSDGMPRSRSMDCLPSQSPLVTDDRTAALLRTAAQLRVKADSSSGPIYALVRWPIVLGLVLVIAVQALLYVLVRLAVFCWELKHRASYRPVAEASTYDEWRDAALRMDQKKGNSCSSAWTEEESIVLGRTQTLRQLIEARDLQSLAKELLLSISMQWGRKFDYEVFFTRSHTGINKTFRDYAHTLNEGLQLVCVSGSLPKQYFGDLASRYGRSALMLSGGAGNGNYHLGCIKALLAQGLLPKVISGSSAGALMATFCCVRSDAELHKALDSPEDLCNLFSSCDEPLSTKFRRLWKSGVLFDDTKWTEKLLVLTRGPITFQEAFERTGRALCISAFDGSARTILLSHVTTPHVVLYSAVLASAAVPHVLPPQSLLVKRPDGTIEPDTDYGSLWRDGSIKEDLPFTKLQQLFNVNFTIVSQVEPHIVPFFFSNRGSAGEPTKHRGGRGFRGGFLLAWLESILKKEMRKWLAVMRDFDLLPSFFGCNWSNLWLQQTHGDVNLVPPLRALDYLHLISHPDPQSMTRYLLTMERATWRKIGWIQAHMHVELTLQSLKGDSNGLVTNSVPLTGTHTPIKLTNETVETVKAQREQALDELTQVVAISQDLTNQVRLLKRRSHVYHAVILGFIVLINVLVWNHSSVLVDLNTEESLDALLELSSSLLWYSGQSLTIIYFVIVMCS